MNGTSHFISPTCSNTSARCGWRHGSGATLHEDLHTGQSGDGRLSTPDWEAPHYNPSEAIWLVPKAVSGPPGKLTPHPMPRSRVLEIVRPMSVSRISDTIHRFRLPHEVAGFCTLLLPAGTPSGTTATIRHGEAEDVGTGLLVDVECTGSLGPNHGLHCNHISYVARGNGTWGMSAHDKSWQRLALHGRSAAARRPGSRRDASSQASDGQFEAFTPAFQFSAFRFVQVTLAGAPQSLDISSITCFRIGVGFDWTGDVAVASAAAESRKEASKPTAAERFNTVVAAARSTAISYVFVAVVCVIMYPAVILCALA